MVDWEELILTLRLMSCGEVTSDEGETVPTIEAKRRELAPVREEIERLQAVVDKLQRVVDTGILPDGDHVNLPTKMWLEELTTEEGPNERSHVT